jgi:hypothetical protein
MRVFTAICVAALASAPALYGQSGSSTIAGCLVTGANGYELAAVPSGYIYRLQGAGTNNLTGRALPLVRLTGKQVVAAGDGQVGVFQVENTHFLPGNCNAGRAPEGGSGMSAITGKTGAGALAVDVSQSPTAATGSLPGHAPPANAGPPALHPEIPTRENNAPERQGMLAPPQWSQIGEDQRTADRDAAAAMRAEEYPGHTLGVNAMPSTTNPNLPQGKPATQGGGEGNVVGIPIQPR